MIDAASIRLATIRATLRAVFAGHAPTDAELRALAARLAVPFVDLWALAGEADNRPRLTRADVEEWLARGGRDTEHDTAGAMPASNHKGG